MSLVSAPPAHQYHPRLLRFAQLLAGVPGLGCLGWGVGHPVSADCASGSVCCSKFFRLFPGSKESLVPWDSSRGWRLRLIDVLQGPVPHL